MKAVDAEIALCPTLIPETICLGLMASRGEARGARYS